jgi:osmoprotectant transport system permease protein
MSFLAYGDSPGNPWFSTRYLRDNAETILAALREHVVVTGLTVLVAAAVAIPLAVLAHRVRRLTGPILALSGVLYTVPSLALFALLAPLLGYGRAPLLVGLVMYALLVIVRNTLTGLGQVPAEVRDAARGMGYGGLRQLVRVELPLALPGIMAGLRLAAVSTVALTTVGAAFGQGALGDLILSGFRNNFYRAQIVTATVLVLLLALAVALTLVGVERLLTPWARRRSP